MARPKIVTEEQIEEMREDRGNRMPYKDIANKHGVSITCVRYNLYDGEKEQMNANARKYQEENRDKFLSTMRNYNNRKKKV
jgi:hypothetical protein